MIRRQKFIAFWSEVSCLKCWFSAYFIISFLCIHIWSFIFY